MRPRTILLFTWRYAMLRCTVITLLLALPLSAAEPTYFEQIGTTGVYKFKDAYTPTGEAGIYWDSSFEAIGNIFNGGQCPALKIGADSATLLTLEQAGGTNVLVTDSRDAYSGVGTGTAGAPRLFVGTLTPTGDDAAICVGRDVQGTGLFSHAFRDESTFAANNAASYTSYDAAATLKGTGNYGHSHGFQHRLIHSGSGTLGATYSHTSNITANGPVGTVAALYITNPSGTSTVQNVFGFLVDPNGLTKGATANYVIYSANTNTPSYHGGLWQCGADISAAGEIRASNIRMKSAENSTFLGRGPTIVAYYATSVGHNAGKALTDGSTYCTMVGTAAGYATTDADNDTYIGAYAGYANTTGSGNIGIGRNAGRYHADGATALTDAENSIYIGYAAKGKDNSDSNSIVIGASAIGLGANTTVIGTTATTDTTLYGVLRGLERSADPAKPAEGGYVIWQSDGTGIGDDGDIMIGITAGGASKYATLVDFSGATTWE